MTARTLAALFSSEPPDGTHLLVWHGGDSTMIWRHDIGAVGERRWFARWNTPPFTLAELLGNADDVQLIVRLDQAGRREAAAVFARVVT